MELPGIDQEKQRLLDVRAKLKNLSNSYVDAVDTIKNLGEKSPIITSWVQSLPTAREFFEVNPEKTTLVQRNRLQKMLDVVDTFIPDSINRTPEEVFTSDNRENLTILSCLLHANYAYSSDSGSIVGWSLKTASDEDFSEFINAVSNKTLPKCLISQEETIRQNNMISMGMDVVPQKSAVETLRKNLLNNKSPSEAFDIVSREFPEK